MLVLWGGFGCFLVGGLVVLCRMFAYCCVVSDICVLFKIHY